MRLLLPQPSLCELFNLPPYALYSSIALINIGFGFGVVTPLNIARVWSKPVNESMDEFNPATMFGLFGTIGTLGGIILPLFLSLMVEEQQNEGYQNYFLLIMAMMLVSAIGVPIIDHQVRHHSNDSISKARSLFLVEFAIHVRIRNIPLIMKNHIGWRGTFNEYHRNN